MKLATLNDGTRDGRLVVVSKDITRCCAAGRIAPTLQYALDHWETVAPALEALYTDVEHWAVPCQRFHEREALSPLPRAYQWVSAVPAPDQGEPVLQQQASGSLLPPRAAVGLADAAGNAVAVAGIACLTDDVPQGAKANEAEGQIRLLLLVCSIDLPGTAGHQSHLASSCSPVAVTPDELGEAWTGTQVRLPVHAQRNGEPLGTASTPGSLAELVAAAARSARLGAGSIVGAAPSSGGDAPASGLQSGDCVRVEMRDAAHHSIFGAIEHTVTAA